MAKFAQIDPNTGAVLTLLDGDENNWPDLKKAGVVKRYTGKLDPGAVWDGSKFVVPEVVPVRVVSPMEFRRRFTNEERRLITQAAVNTALEGDTDIQEAVDEMGLGPEVSLDSEDAARWMRVFIKADLINRRRADEILA